MSYVMDANCSSRCNAGTAAGKGDTAAADSSTEPSDRRHPCRARVRRLGQADISLAATGHEVTPGHDVSFGATASNARVQRHHRSHHKEYRPLGPEKVGSDSIPKRRALHR